MAKNKDTALEFLRAASSGKARAAFARLATPGFRHHNPYFAAGADTLGAAMDENAEKFPDKLFEVQRAIEDGDFVAVHSRVRMKPGDADLAAVHVFRFESGRIAELWDIVQQVPANSPNPLGMF